MLKCYINAVSYIVRQLLSNMMIISGIDIDRDLQTMYQCSIFSLLIIGGVGGQRNKQRCWALYLDSTGERSCSGSCFEISHVVADVNAKSAEGKLLDFRIVF